MIPRVVQAQSLDKSSGRPRFPRIAEAHDRRTQQWLMTGTIKFARIMFQMIGIQSRAGKRFRVIDIGQEDDAHS
jgi:hypothetical protein